MKKYLFYTLLLVALFIGISATTSKAVEFADLTIKIKTEDGYGIYKSQPLAFKIKAHSSMTRSIDLTNLRTTKTGMFGPAAPDEDTVTLFPNYTNGSDETGHNLFYPEEGTFVIEDLPVGTHYEIVAGNTGSELVDVVEYYTEDEESGDLPAEGAVITYTIKQKNIDKIQITYNDTAPDYDTPDMSCKLSLYANSMIPEKIHYKSSLNPDTLLEMDTTMLNEDSKEFNKIFTLTRGESIIIEDAPLGLLYYLSPYTYGDAQIPSPYRIKYNQGQSGQIVSGVIDYFYNVSANQEAGIVIDKQISGAGIDLDKEFTFKITAAGLQQDGTYAPLQSTYLYQVLDAESGEVLETREADFEDGVAYIKCMAGQKIAIGRVQELREIQEFNGGSKEINFANQIQQYTHYKIEEVNAEKYEVTYDNAEGDSLNNYTNNVVITNARNLNGKLTIKKQVTENVSENEEFTFKIKLIDSATDLPTEYEYTGSKQGTLQFEDGIASITLKANESITIEGLPVGAEYKVTEENTGDTYTLSSENTEGTIAEDTTAIFINTTDKKEEKKEEESAPRTGDYVILYSLIGLAGLILAISIKKKIK